MVTRINGIALLAGLTFGFVISRSAAADIDEQQGLYIPGLTISGRQTENGQPVPGAKHHLERCDVLLWVTSDGIIRIAQVIKSTGHSRLDEACLRGAIGQRLNPARRRMDRSITGPFCPLPGISKGKIQHHPTG
jgi:hypothetical protein